MSLFEERKEENVDHYQNQRAASPEPSYVSDASMRQPIYFSDGTGTSNFRKIFIVTKKTGSKMSLFEEREEKDVDHYQNQRTICPEPSYVSDASMRQPIYFSDGTGTSNFRRKRKRATSPQPIYQPLNLSDGAMTFKPSNHRKKRKRASSPEPSCVSLKSDRSINQPSNLCKRSVTFKHRVDQTGDLQKKSHQSMDDKLKKVKDQHKTSMKKKYERLYEGIKLQENQTFLNRIYTQLYIIEGESEGVNGEHEVLQMEKSARTHHSQATAIYCNDIFKPLPEPRCKEKDKIKTVLTKGIAGIGKTVSVQKFILDWAEGKANRDVDFMFVLPFRELNLIKDHRYSLHKLLLVFHPELQELNSKIYEKCKVVFIFDGLDESKMALMFSDPQKVSDVTKISSVGLLMSNLMKGKLLPSAFIWITSRPSAASQIPSKYINRLTEIQGFNEPQKEEYFRKRISDEHQASKIISHIKRVRSLHIMCHIPVFCWISSTVLQKLLKEDLNAEIPQTLTEMYIHFLLTQITIRNQKYEKRYPVQLQSNKKVIVKLAELAFNQLMKGNVMFYEEDLRESGIDITDASVYSGICTEIFKEESVIHQRKVYCFIHLSFQEFLAAFYVFYSHLLKKMEPLKLILNDKHEKYTSENSPLFELLISAVKKTLQSKNGHLDLFLRFLLGISLESNQRVLQALLTCTENSSETIRKIKKDIKNRIKGKNRLSAEQSINMFLCLLEVKDQTLFREIQHFVKSDKKKKLTPSHCSAIAYMLQMSEEVLDEFDLMNYNTSSEGRRRLLPAVINCSKALLAGCGLSDQHCESLCVALQSESHLRELDLSKNDIRDSGVKLLSAALKSSHCQVNILRLVNCNLTGQCCESLSSALQASKAHLRELDLSNNDLQDSGLKMLLTGLTSSKCQVNILRLSGCMVTEKGCHYVSSALSSNSLNLRELDLSYNHPGDAGVKLLSKKLEDPNCTLRKLNVDHGGVFMITAGLHKYTRFLTLDPKTAETQLILTEGNRKVIRTNKEQSYPDHPERFDVCRQVLCKESLTGRCYWEAEWRGYSVISVTYKGISRKGRSHECRFGRNKKSWSLICSDDGLTARHNNNSTDIHVPLHSCKRVGVYLDWLAGSLSFYSVSDAHTFTHLHTFTSTFTESLYAGFGVYGFFVCLRSRVQQPRRHIHV